MPDRIFHVHPGVSLALVDVIVQGGNAPGDGGAILAETGTTLTLTNVGLEDHRAGGTGGGIMTSGMATLENSGIERAVAVGPGGCIFVAPEGSLTMSGASISQCRASQGGGLSTQGQTSLTNVVVLQNSTTGGPSAGLGVACSSPGLPRLSPSRAAW